MAEKENLEMLSALMGKQGQDAVAMLQRMERLKRLMGNPQPVQKPAPMEQQEETTLFARNQQESMIAAAIPFLDREYQREIYIIVRLMEMQRVLQGNLLEAREKQEEPPALRRRKLLGAVQAYLPAQEKQQFQMMLKMMDMKEIMEREGLQ